MGDALQVLVGHVTELVAAHASRLAAALVVIVGLLVWRVARRALDVVVRVGGVDATTGAFIAQIAKFLVSTIVVLAALDVIGVNTVSILTSLGVVGLTVGFAAKDALSNLISGLFIFWDRPFVVGDLVEIDSVYGFVDRITLRTTRLVTPDGRMVSLPNTAVINAKVASYTSFPHLRLDIAVGIGVKEDVARVRRLLLEVVADDPRFMRDPAPVVVITALNDFNVSVELQAWIFDERQHFVLRAWLRERLFEVLRSAGVDLPFETLAIVRSAADVGAAGAGVVT